MENKGNRGFISRTSALTRSIAVFAFIWPF